MPVCTTCSTALPHLYTLYSSTNIRLTPCGSCKAFADPYIEAPPLSILLDLVLLKPGVYRHLLWNRGSEPERKRGSLPPREPDFWDGRRRRTLVVLGATLVLADAFIRWLHLRPLHNPGNGLAPLEANLTEVHADASEAVHTFLRTCLGCLIETIAFHLGVVLSSSIYLRLRPDAPRVPAILIPLALLYSSMTKLSLLLLLSLFPQTTALPPQPALNGFLAFSEMPMQARDAAGAVWIALDDGVLDREWVVRSLLGGMSAGFGLRVLLSSSPLPTTLLILCGWGAKTAAARAVGDWVVAGGGARRHLYEQFSIP